MNVKFINKGKNGIRKKFVSHYIDQFDWSVSQSISNIVFDKREISIFFETRDHHASASIKFNFQITAPRNEQLITYYPAANPEPRDSSGTRVAS